MFRRQVDTALVRHPSDLFRVIVSALLFLLAALFARQSYVGTLEKDIFRLINDFPDLLQKPVWLVMQAGSAAAIPVIVLVALTARRFRLALELAIGGGAAYGLAKLGKMLSARTRPNELLEQYLIRGAQAAGLGFPSGHVAVATALATILSPYLEKWPRRVVWGVVWVVCLARMYVGAHLPLDVLGGLLLGYMVGSAVNLAFGSPGGKPRPSAVLHALQDAGLAASSLAVMNTDARGSYPFVAMLPDDEKVFVKSVGRDQRDADLLFKLWRYFVFKEADDEEPFITPKRQVEHEAFVSLLAERAGIRTPRLLMATELPDGTALMAKEMIKATDLHHLPVEELSDDLLRKIWEQVQMLHAEHISHGDLRATNIMVDEEKEPWLIDFGFAQWDAGPERMARDRAELLASLAALVGPERSVQAAAEVLDSEDLAAAVPLLQGIALSTASRDALDGAEDNLKTMREAITNISGEEPEVKSLTRIDRQALLWLAGAGLAIYLLLPQWDQVRQAFGSMGSVDPIWMAMALVAAAAVFPAAALAMIGATATRLPYVRTTLIQLAGSFLNRITPKGVGGMGLNARYLEREGLESPAAVAAIGLMMAMGAVTHFLTLIVALALVGTSSSLSLPSIGIIEILIVAVVVLSLAGLLLSSSRWRKRLLDPVREAWHSLLAVIRTPIYAAQLLAGSLGVTLLNIAVLVLSLHAVGAPLSVVRTAAAYLGGSAVAGVAPTPGGLGAMEAALIAALAAFGIGRGQAVAGVLIFRLFTFWLPILPGFIAFRYLQRKEVV